MTLEDTYFDGAVNVFEGHWISEQPIGPKYIGEKPVTSGYLSSGGISRRPLELATLFFTRPEGVGSRFTVPLDRESFVFRGEGSVSL